MIKFSIITVCLNAGNDLLETVESTLKQSYDEFEIIVKDGFSKDCSIEKLPQNKKVCVYQEKDKSVYDAMNQAIAYATGDYCLFINAGDTLYEPSTLQLIADFIEKSWRFLLRKESHVVIWCNELWAGEGYKVFLLSNHDVPSGNGYQNFLPKRKRL